MGFLEGGDVNTFFDHEVNNGVKFTPQANSWGARLRNGLTDDRPGYYNNINGLLPSLSQPSI